MNDGLATGQRLAISGILANHPKITRAVLFGSRAMGNFRPASDLDLVLFGDGLTIGDLITLRAAIAGLNLPMEVDLIIHDQVANQGLLLHIAGKGKDFFIR
jgi:predicted nucleotidyltransferase